MSLSAFIIHSLGLSFWVFLRMVPVLILCGAVLIGAILTITNPIVMAMILVVAGLLGGPFITLTGIRAGLAALKATDAVAPAKLLAGSLRLFFCQQLPTAVLTVILVLVGGGVIFGALYLVAPDIFSPLFETLTEAEQLATVSKLLPMILFIGYLATSVAFAVFAVPMGATAANVVQKSPGYDIVWGIGREFLPVFTVSFLITAVPSILVTALLPQVLEPAFFEALVLQAGQDVLALGAVAVASVAFVLFYLYTPFITWASVALAFVNHRETSHALAEAEKAAIFGIDVSPEDHKEELRSLRRRRGGDEAARSGAVYRPSAPRPDDRPPRRPRLEPDPDNVFKDDEVENIFR